MTNAPSIYEFTSADVILHELGSHVKTLPTVIPCPKHPEYKMIVHPDGSGMWGACSEINFYGDTIDILRLHYGVRTLNEVLWKMEDAGCIHDRREITEKIVSEYEIDRIKRISFKKYWAECQHNMLKLKCDFDLGTLMGKEAPEDKPIWRESFARYVGSDLTKNVEHELAKRLAIKAREVIMVPYYDMPDRVATLRIFYLKNGEVEYIDKQFGRSGGLFMAETVPPDSDLAIALNDPILMLKLQARHAVDSATPLPLIGYNDKTGYWPIWTKRLIFWGPEPTVQMFKQARKNPSSAISTPKKTVDPEKVTAAESSVWLQHVITDAKPWVIALKDHILNIDKERAEAVLAELDLTGEEKGLLMYECDADEKQIVKGLMSAENVQRQAMIGDQKFIERDGTWSVVTPKGRLQRISTATFTIEKSADYGKQGMFLIGTVTSGGQSRKFCAPVKEFTANPVLWLTDFMLRRGMGILQTVKVWNKKLLDVAYAFSCQKIEHVTCSPVVGWSEDKVRFRFPNLTLYNGLIDDSDIGVPAYGNPCERVSDRMIASSVISKLVEMSDVNRYFWALFLLSVYNLTAKYVGVPFKKIGITGHTRMLDIFSSAIDLKFLNIPTRASVYRTAASEVQYHDVPHCIIIEGNFKGVATWLEDVTEKNLMVGLNDMQGTIIGGINWLFLPIKDLAGDMSHLKDVENLVPMYVKGLQLAGVQASSDPIVVAHRLIKEWLAQRLPEADLSVLDEAAMMIRHETPLGQVDYADRVICAIFSLARMGKIDFVNIGYGRNTDCVKLDSKYVIIPADIFLNFPVNGSQAVLAAELKKKGVLADSNLSEITVTRKYWDKLYDFWNSKTIA